MVFLKFNVPETFLTSLPSNSMPLEKTGNPLKPMGLQIPFKEIVSW
jgi:hypothetical protein